MDAAAVGRLPEPALEPVGRDVEGLVEVLGAGLAAHHRTAGTAGDLDVLAAAVLPRVLLVLEFDVGSDDLVVVTFQLRQFLGDVLPVVIGNGDVAASDDDLHVATRDSFHATSTMLGTRRSGAGEASGAWPKRVVVGQDVVWLTLDRLPGPLPMGDHAASARLRPGR